jgi:hypothetical protein
MVRTTWRLRRALALALMLSLPSAGCFATHHQHLEANASLDDVTGITTRSGRDIPFAMPGATIANDTLVASGPVGPLKVPTDSVARITKRGFSVWRTAVLFVGVSAAALTALVVATCCPAIP